ncbi:putative rieske domain protein [Mycobacterium kansasii]|uniref:Putative rieske domain protein n=1 Tax=Mycobacterium kansasii TaxID=1768 RepID=A0A1V3WHP2_MYCKA|nr:putative rieske domain protein [Mycobacterium kansasii]
MNEPECWTPGAVDRQESSSATGPAEIETSDQRNVARSSGPSALTDVVIGSFLSASLLDVIAPHSGGRPHGGDQRGHYRDVTHRAHRHQRLGRHRTFRRTGTPRRSGPCRTEQRALLLYTASLRAVGAIGGYPACCSRSPGHRTWVQRIPGGHMSYMRGIGVNQTAFDPGPPQWTRCLTAPSFVTTTARHCCRGRAGTAGAPQRRALCHSQPL